MQADRKTSLKVGVCQVAPLIGDPVTSLRRTCEAIERVAGAGADVVVLPELAVSGYAFRDMKEAFGAAEPLDGPAVTAWSDLSGRHDLVVVAGIAERGEDGLAYNSGVVIDGGKLLHVYRKVHLWDFERDRFKPGDDLPPVVETSRGPIGLGICYDLMFPEVSRHLTRAGGRLLCFPTNSPKPADGPAAEFEGEVSMEVVVARATAYVNRAVVVIADRGGPEERGNEWVGCSVVADADGQIVAVADGADPTEFVADVDLGAAIDRRWGYCSDVDADRRPELYRQMLS